MAHQCFKKVLVAFSSEMRFYFPLFIFLAFNLFHIVFRVICFSFLTNPSPPSSPPHFPFPAVPHYPFAIATLLDPLELTTRRRPPQTSRSTIPTDSKFHLQGNKGPQGRNEMTGGGKRHDGNIQHGSGKGCNDKLQRKIKGHNTESQ